MSEQVAKYSAHVRMSDADYAGVMAQVNETCRVVVNPAGTRYAVQIGSTLDGETVWAGQSYGTLSKLLEKQAPQVQGLANACMGLPELPDAALPDLQDQRRELLDGFKGTDWRRDDYARVVEQDGNMRLVVSPCGTQYRLQWVSVEAFNTIETLLALSWSTIRTSTSIAAIKRHFLEVVGSVHDEWRYTASDEPVDKSQVAPALQAAFEQVPTLAEDGQWPALPARPETVRD